MMHASFKIAAICVSFNCLLQADGAVVNARSLSRADVESAVASAREGDTVVVPAGKEDWKSTLTVTKAITLQFAGIGQSVILDDIITQNPRGGPGWSQGVINFSTKPDKLYRLTGLEIDKGLERTNLFYGGAIQITGSTTEFRIDHCGFFQLLNRGISTWESTCGVIDHCVFNLQGQSYALLIHHELWAGQTFGDGSWDTPAGWGTSNAVYIEDCVFSNTTKVPWSAVDSYSGARWVFRHNKVLNANMVTHGTESTGLNRGARFCEIYLNECRDEKHWPNMIKLRSASAVIWSNTASGYRVLCVPDDYRNTDFLGFWGAANGINLLDKNEPGPILVVTHTGPAGSTNLIVAGADWKVNQWAGYSVIDINTQGTTNFGIIYSNTATEAYLSDPQVHKPTVFNTGDTIQFYKVVAALDMPGMGMSAKLSRGAGSKPLPPWPNQQIEPIYSWGNTLNGADGGVTPRIAILVEGVHFFNDTPKPGYTPFTYPHPLTVSP
jgi:hypothetical protein